MSSVFPPPSPSQPVPADYDVIVATAARLAADPARATRLSGRNLALLCDEGSTEDDARLFQEAGVGLGARVAQLRSAAPRRRGGTERGVNDPQDLRRMGDALSQLYDAVECLGLPPGDVAPLREAAAGVPVFDGISSAAHASAQLADRLDATLPLRDRRALIVQAILLRALR